MNIRRSLSACLLAIGLAACADATPPTADGSQDGQVEVIGGDEEALRAFIGQYLNVGPNDRRVTIGALPDNLPIALDLPSQSEITGTIMTAYTDGSRSWALLFNTDDTAEAVMDFYRGAFSDAVWALPHDQEGGGFTRPDPYYLAYCHLEEPIMVSVVATESDPTRVSVYLSEDLANPACGERSDLIDSTDAMRLIPALLPPEGIDQRQGEGGGASAEDGPNAFVSAYQTVTLRGDTSAAAIADTYTLQLEEAGWERVSEGRAEDAAWSNWTFTDEQGKTWTALLFVVETVEPDEWFGWISIRWEAASD